MRKNRTLFVKLSRTDRKEGWPSWFYRALFAGVAIRGFIVSLGGGSALGKILAEE